MTAFSKKNFKTFSFFTLCFTLGVILWGAWVRFSHSGDGCGNNWPLCKGKFFAQDSAAFIEWIHRVSSGLSFLLILTLLALSLKIYPKRHLIRKSALAAFGLIIVEALIGAGLVLASLTGSNSSSLRAGVLAFHLLNSLFLIGSLVFCWQGSLFSKIKIKKPLIYFTLLFPLLALSGSFASLANTLFPTTSLLEALSLDLKPHHITLRLRPFHPFLAVLFVLAFVFQFRKTKELILPLSTALFALFFGFAALLALSPLWMKLSHLFIAYFLWILLVKHSFSFEN